MHKSTSLRDYKPLVASLASQMMMVMLLVTGMVLAMMHISQATLTSWSSVSVNLQNTSCGTSKGSEYIYGDMGQILKCPRRIEVKLNKHSDGHVYLQVGLTDIHPSDDQARQEDNYISFGTYDDTTESLLPWTFTEGELSSMYMMLQFDYSAVTSEGSPNEVGYTMGGEIFFFKNRSDIATEVVPSFCLV